MASTVERVGRPGGRRRDQVVPASPTRSRRARLNVSSTPGRLWLLLAILVLFSLAWGALAAFAVQQYASAASGVVDAREPLSLDALRIYQRLCADGAWAASYARWVGTPVPKPPAAQYAGLPDAARTRSRSAPRSSRRSGLGWTLERHPGPFEMTDVDLPPGWPRF